MAKLSDFTNFVWADMSVDQKCDVLEGVINKTFEDFEDGALKDGTESLSLLCEEVLEKAGLLEKDQRFYWRQVAAHPCNREGALFVPVDVHDLLRRFARDGFNVRVWKALACSRPPGPLGDSWVRRNNDVVAGSDGLLPSYDYDEVRIFTGRGSHGTAAVRVQESESTIAIHKELAGPDGLVSKARIIEKQPSMATPGRDGCLYDVLHYKVVIRCPGLMPFLSRSGNNQHTVVRHPTALQHCFRVQGLIQSGMKNENLIQAACIGMPDEFAEIVRCNIQPFVVAWSGGDSGHLLKDLEAYERTLTQRKKIAYETLEAMSRLSYNSLQYYVPAMVKASLNSPISEPDGTSTLFSAGDVASIGANGKNREHAVQANDIMHKCHTFISAYTNPSKMGVAMSKVLHDLEIRLVMHAQGKKFDTRRQFRSQKEIAQAMWDAAKVVDLDLPCWPYLSDVVALPKDYTKAEQAPRLREIRKDGKVPDAELVALGFKVGIRICDAAGNEYTLLSFDTQLLNVTANDGDDKAFQIDRRELKDEYTIKAEEEQPVIHKTMIDAEGESFKADIWKAVVKTQSLDELRNKSHEDDVSIVEKPAIGVIVDRAFKAGAMVLVGFSPNVSVTTKPIVETSAAFYRVQSKCCSNKKAKVIIRKSLCFPKEITVSGVAHAAAPTSCVTAFWAVPEVTNASLANCALEMKEMSVKLGKESYTFNMPIIRNTRDLKKGQRLLMDTNKSQAFRERWNVDKVEPPTKKQKTSKGKGKGK